MNTRHHRGFTLIELMMALLVGSILFGVAIPSFRTFAQNSRLTGAANDLLASVQTARTEALKRQGNVALCPTADPNAAVPVCGNGNAWVVWQDRNADWQIASDGSEPIIERHDAIDASVRINGDGGARISYAATGFPTTTVGQVQTRNVVFCDSRGLTTSGNQSTGRALLISTTGRARVSSVPAEVSAALSATGGTCP